MTPTAQNLSESDRDLVQRILSNPLEFPDIFKSWLTTYLEGPGAPQVYLGQIAGYTQTIPQISEIDTSETTASTAYADLATVGPQLTGLESGRYQIHYGAELSSSAPATQRISLSLNGAAPSDNDAASVNNAGTTSGFMVFVSRATVKDLSSTSNSVKLQYKTSTGTLTVARRFLIVVRLQNL